MDRTRVYSSPEKAMAAYPGQSWTYVEQIGQWQNGQRWNDCVLITRFTLDETMY